MNPAMNCKGCRPLAHVRAIAPYVPGKPITELAREFGLNEADIVKLASNENPLGISPLAKAAVAAALDELALYPDGNGFALKQKLAQRLGVGMGQIVLGNGSNDVLEIAARVFLAPGRSAVFSQHAFAVYPLAIAACNATPIEVPARNFGHDLAAMLAAIRPDTAMVFIANPNNPTGTLLGNAELADFLAAVPKGVIVVLDEAYTEFLDTPSASLDWLSQHINLIITRTFSKAYGLAGLRVGYALAAACVADLLNRIRQPFNVNSLALTAACAALDDHDFLARSKRVNDEGRAQLMAGCKRLNLSFIPSAGNFICIKVGDTAEAAQAVYLGLLRRGVIVRPVANYGLHGYLRVSMGLPHQNDRFLAALAEVLS
jgi:histidinol-phosphate aminotransferase